MRSKLSRCLYLLLVDVIACYLVVFPAYAFQVSSSTTGYVRVASQAAMSTMLTAQRSATLASLGPLISASTAGSVAVRLVASSVGWPLLGVVAGVTLAMAIYDATRVAAIKAGATGPGTIPTWGGNNGNTTITSVHACPGAPACTGGMDQYVQFPTSIHGGGQCHYVGTTPAGWSGPVNGSPLGPYCLMFHMTGGANSVVPGPPPTSSDIATYVGNLPANDPLSLESNTVSVGAQSTPAPADATASQPIPESGLATTVVPATSVQPTDTVINPNAIAPSGTETTKTQTQTTSTATTTTSTTTTNPDGSVTTTSTETAEETAPVACTSGTHDQRTFGSILQAHMDQWQGSGLLGALNLLKTLTWPSTPPVYTLTSTTWGTHSIDFSGWTGIFVVLRSILIAVASFVAYQIIFVGGRAS